MGRIQTALLPVFLCVHIFVERETSGYEAARETYFDTKLWFCHSQAVSQVAWRIRTCNWHHEQNKLWHSSIQPLTFCLLQSFWWTLSCLKTKARRHRARSIQPKFQPVRPGKVVHLKRWTRVFETFPVGPNRSIEFWTEISGNFGWMDHAHTPCLGGRSLTRPLSSSRDASRHKGETERRLGTSQGRPLGSLYLLRLGLLAKLLINDWRASVNKPKEATKNIQLNC